MPTYYGELTGKNYDSVEALRHYEGLEAMRRNAPSKEEEAVETMTPEELRSGIERLMRSEQQKVAQVQASIDLAAFLQSHPEYEDSDQNGAALRRCLIGMGVQDLTTVNFYQVEEAFNRLSQTGELKLNAGAVKKQVERAVSNRVKEIEQERNVNWDELYSMPLDELRRRASGVNQ